MSMTELVPANQPDLPDSGQVADLSLYNRRTRRANIHLFGRGKIANSNVIDMRRGTSLIASAQALTQTKTKDAVHRKSESWMSDAWTSFDLVGELHFLSTTLSRRAARARFFVGKIDGTDVLEIEAPVAVPATATTPAKPAPAMAPLDKKATIVFQSFGDGFIGSQEIVERAFLNQFIVGACYLVGATAETWLGQPPKPVNQTPVGELVWRTLSVRELIETENGYEIRQAGSQSRTYQPLLKIPQSGAYVITLWSPHPADSTTPDSPVRATLPVLRELIGLTQHVSAQIDSRLAGAGLLIMRSSASRAIKRSLGLSEDDPRDPFTEMLIEAMVTPVADRDSASAIVPYVVTIPDDSAVPTYLSFAAPLDTAAPALREESIRRIALSLDAPPQLLLGAEDSTHWSAWLTQQEVVDSHITPTLALIARALTTEFLRPILRQNGVSVSDAQQYAVWFDTSDLVIQANQATDAQVLYQLGLLSDETTRRANGFDESDAPKKTDNKEAAIDLVKQMVIANPGLMNRPGLDVLVTQLQALLDGTPKSGLAAGQAAIASSGSAEIAPASGTPGGAPVSPGSAPAPLPLKPPAIPSPPKPAAPPAISAGGGNMPGGGGVPGSRVAAVLERQSAQFGQWDPEQ